MKRENDVPMPEPLRDALRDAEPEKQRGLERIWSRLPDEEADVYPDVDDAFADILGRIERGPSTASSGRRPTADRRLEADRRPNVDRRGRRTGRHSAGIAVAATLMVIFVAAGLWAVYRPVVYETAAAEQRTVQLADGSVVELNSETTLRVASRFESTLLRASGARRVHLSGEAFFSVAQNPREFVVETSDALVRVTGTEFNIRSRTDRVDLGTQVTLVEGSVVVTNRDGNEDAVTLDVPGAVAQVGVSPGAVLSRRAEAELDHVLAWRRQGFAFIDTPVDAILDELERRFDVSIDPRSGVDLTEPMNLIYSRGVTPEEVLSDICVDQSCVYRVTSRGYALTAQSRP